MVVAGLFADDSYILLNDKTEKFDMRRQMIHKLNVVLRKKIFVNLMCYNLRMRLAI